jgi:hypothetical protein
MTTILNFDKWSKCELFKEYLGRVRTIKCLYSYDVDEALKLIKEKKPDIILLGGDVSGEYKAAKLVGKMRLDKDIAPKIFKKILITTWDSDEARLLRALLPHSFYCPFSESLANIVKQKSKNVITYKRIKNAKT